MRQIWRRAVASASSLLALTGLAAASGPRHEPVLGVTWGRGGEVVWLDPLTLRPTARARVRISPPFSTARSQDGRTLAVAHASTLHLLDARSLRTRRVVHGLNAWLGATAWPTPHRLLTLPPPLARGSAIVLDPFTGKTVARSPLSGVPLAIATRPDAILLLLGQEHGIGPVALALARADGTVRSVGIPEIEAGFETAAPGSSTSQQAQAGLAIDPSGRRAAVVTPELVADVELESLTVNVHALVERRPSSIRKALTGWNRNAVWMTPELLAVSGSNDTRVDDRNVQHAPAGLVLVDTRTWRTRHIEPGATSVIKAGGRLLATGTRCDSRSGTCRGIGLRGYTLDGRPTFHLFGSESVTVDGWADGLAYLSDCNSSCYRIADTRSGRLVARVKLQHQTVLAQ